MNTRHTIAVGTTDVRIGDNVVVAFATERTVALVGIVGTVSRIRAWDELTGEPIGTPSDRFDPEFWFSDMRTEIEVGPIRRSEISTIGLVDGPWLSPQEMRDHLGTDEIGPQDCDDPGPDRS